MAYHCLDVSLLQVELDLVYGKRYFQSLWYLIHLQELYLTMTPPFLGYITSQLYAIILFIFLSYTQLS